MNRMLRAALYAIAVLQGIVGIGMALHVPFFDGLWQSVLPEATPLSLSFVGSIFAAAAASTLWCLVADEEAGLAGIGLDYGVIMLPLAAFFAGRIGANAAQAPYAAMTLAGAAFGAYLYWTTRRLPFRQGEPPPRLVRVSFVVFTLALLFYGGRMVLGVPNTMPWPTSAAESVVYGWMFLGAAAYFVYALVRPSWGNAGGQLAGFLAYDLVLLPPFLSRFGTAIPAQFVVGHWIYTAVVTCSALLAAYYLFVDPRTRLLGRA